MAIQDTARSVEAGSALPARRAATRLGHRAFLLRIGAVDLLSLAAATAAASWILFRTPLPWQAALVGHRVLPFLGYLAASAVLSSALSSGLERRIPPRPSYLRAGVIVVGTFVMTAVLVLLTFSYVSRPLFGGVMVLWCAAVYGYRVWHRRHPWAEPMVIISSEEPLVAALQGSEHAQVLRLVDPQEQRELELPAAGITVAVDLRAVLAPRVAQFVSSCAVAGYPVRPFTEVYEDHTGRVPLVSLAEGWEISAPLSRNIPYLPIKRVADIVLVLATLPAWAPLLALVALLVRLSSRGPVIFRQWRVGLGERPFMLYKFRTMREDAERDGPRFTSHGDPRLTAVGRALRRTHLDELPQLWNVLRGDLSLVGPRPEQAAFVREFNRQIPFYSDRHLVRPGITGWAQVRYGYADDQAETIEKLSYDLYYIKHMSPFFDLRILWHSIGTILSGSGAR
ncbi:MAG: exopolysaccharide biosynthesis polyprenyl glycosylphosphotransferase [Thermoanaerobaculia bacterium]